MKKILLLLTGGTIGSFGNEEGLCRSVDTGKAKRLLLSHFENSDSCCVKDVEFDVHVIMDTLSEYMSVREWEKIYKELKKYLFVREKKLVAEPKEIHPERRLAENATEIVCDSDDMESDAPDYQGIIITHGTDTLSFTSAFLSEVIELELMREKVERHRQAALCPIFLVSSQAPLTDPSANGDINFRIAVECICAGIAPGVYVPYRNMDGTMYLHKGLYLNACPDASDDFSSLEAKSLSLLPECTGSPSCIQSGTQYGIPSGIQSLGQFSPKFQLPYLSDSIFQKMQHLESGVLLLRPYPGLDYRFISLENGVQAVVHGLYHSQTACSQEAYDENDVAKTSVLWFLRRCQEKKLPVFFAPMDEEKLRYRSELAILSEGGVGLAGYTVEAAYALVTIGLSLGYRGQELVRFIKGER